MANCILITANSNSSTSINATSTDTLTATTLVNTSTGTKLNLEQTNCDNKLNDETNEINEFKESIFSTTRKSCDESCEKLEDDYLNETNTIPDSLIKPIDLTSKFDCVSTGKLNCNLIDTSITPSISNILLIFLFLSN